MEEATLQALRTDRLIDITTVGRKTGNHSRKEMNFYNLGGDIYITGRPGRRDWYANLIDNPEFTFHLKESIAADLKARAIPITDPDRKREILTPILDSRDRSGELDEWVARSPLVKVDFGHDQRSEFSNG